MIGKIKIDGAAAVQKKLDWLQRQSRRHNNVGVIVGYSASYALYVHENREIHPPGMILAGKPRGGKSSGRNKATGRFTAGSKSKRKGYFWDPQGRAQPKFLEQPFRTLRSTLISNVYTITKSLGISRGNGLDKGLYTAGLLLQRVSQELVPVEHVIGLKASAFTHLIHDNRGKG